MEKASESNYSSGIPALDEILQKVLAGDNVVFQVETIEAYIPFVKAFCAYNNAENLDLVYFRFAQHPYLLPENIRATTYRLYPERGFDYFISEIINIIETHGIGACYVFDSLSDLAADWYSNIMLGNFFMLICPYLRQLDTVAYFALLRHYQDSETFKNIHDTAQVVIDVYYDETKALYIHPLKVFNRYSSTIYMLHKWVEIEKPLSKFKTIKQSAKIAEILTKKHYQWLDPSKEHVDAWHISFYEAQKTLEGLVLGEISLRETTLFKSKLLRKAVVQDDLQLILATKYLELDDILNIRNRMIGTGYIGGKSFGMLLARAILKKEKPEVLKRLEEHDSFYIGTEVFYTFLVKNGCWWMRRKLSNPKTLLERWKETRKKILEGQFPDYFVERMIEILNYFGQAPIIVRSSSLQEDAYGNSFSGKYESVFCVNQGTLEERLNEVLDAVRRVYASAVSPNAMEYRKSRGLLEDDEQMALLVQRVSGSIYGNYFFPQIAGTGFSYNPYVWNENIDPNSGFLRLVFGLGTRAVERIEDDFTRIVALNKPLLRVESTLEEIEVHSQKKVDLLDIEKNRFVTIDFVNLKNIGDMLPLRTVATYDYELEKRMQLLNRPIIFPWVLTFTNLLKNANFIQDMREILNTLEKAYQCPVDIEYTVNFLEDNTYRINLLQCRRFPVRCEIKDLAKPEDIKPETIVIKTTGPIIGNSITKKIDQIIYIVPEVYGKMSETDRYSIARLVGKINQLNANSKKRNMVIGPGRWGTSSPSFGITVSFAEISNFSIICEMADKIGELVPDVSLGTHLFVNLVESDILYVVLHPEKEGYTINRAFFQTSKNALEELIPDSQRWSDVVKIIDFTSDTSEWDLNVFMNAYTQQGVCYLSKKEEKNERSEFY